MTKPQAEERRTRFRRPTGDDGSTIPLILGFFLIGLLFTGAAVAVSDTFTKQRDLQSTCDSAALAAANHMSTSAARTGLGDALPIGDIDATISDYLTRGNSTNPIQAEATLTDNQTTVQLVCHQHNTVAFGALILRPDGIDQRVEANARSRISP